MFKQYIINIILICFLIVGVLGDGITIKTITTNPTTDPKSIDNGKGEKTCAGITAQVELSAETTGVVTATLQNNVGTILISKKEGSIYTISGIELKEGDSLSGLTVSIDNAPIGLGENVQTPTLKCEPTTSESSGDNDSSSTINGDSSSSNTTPTTTLPKVTSISAESASAVATETSGVSKFCTSVKVNFNLDTIITDTSTLKPVYSSFPVIGGKKTTSVQITGPTTAEYNFLLDVLVGGNLDDLSIEYKGEKLTLPNTVSFTCKTSGDTGSSQSQPGDGTTSQELPPTTSTTTVTSITSTKSSDIANNGVCSNTIQFSLDNAPTSVSDLQVVSASISNTPTITQKADDTKTFTATFNVKQESNLNDLTIKLKDTTISTSSSKITFICNKPTSTVPDDDGDGSTGSSLSFNTYLTLCFSFLLFCLN